jgi:hypothetical protein
MKDMLEKLSEDFYNQYLIASINGDKDRAIEMLNGRKLVSSLICRNLHELQDCKDKYGDKLPNSEIF